METFRNQGYQSQFGQDVFFDALFRSIGLERGVFVDVGAHDGLSGSNTVFFERRGWSGVCIEPLPGPFARLEDARSARCFNCAVGEVEGEQAFFSISGYSEMLSGLVSQYDPRHLSRLEEELLEYGGERREVFVPVRRLDGILDECGIDCIDLLSIDVEGGEMSVIRSLDLTRTTIFTLAIENGYGDDEVARYLAERSGLRRVLRVDVDDLYVDLPELRGRLSFRGAPA